MDILDCKQAIFSSCIIFIVLRSWSALAVRYAIEMGG